MGEKYLTLLCMTEGRDIILEIVEIDIIYMFDI